jgi:ElaB/YqjD/DUF883 family membrane-anchored ribosome-binding protein
MALGVLLGNAPVLKLLRTILSLFVREITMSTESNLSKGARDSGSRAKDTVSAMAEDLQSGAGPLIRDTARRAKSTAQQTFAAAGDIADQARDMAVNAIDSVVKYTKQNPVKALAVAAASGALLYAAIKALRSYRD